MNAETTSFDELVSDETAFALSEALHWLTRECEAKLCPDSTPPGDPVRGQAG